jgi:diaminopimelate decarboxylase
MNEVWEVEAVEPTESDVAHNRFGFKLRDKESLLKHCQEETQKVEVSFYTHSQQRAINNVALAILTLATVLNEMKK